MNSQNRALVTIDIDRGVATLDAAGTPWPQTRKFHEFYALLATRRDRLLTAEELRRYGRWTLGQFASVGKDVARHLKELERRGLDFLVEPEGKTKAWRLALRPSQVHLLPSRKAVEQWLAQQDHGGRVVPRQLYPWLRDATCAVLALQAGELDRARQLIRNSLEQVRDSVILGGVTEILEARMASRLEQRSPRPSYLPLCEGSLGRALRHRFQLVEIKLDRLSNPGRALDRLSEIVPEIESGTDLNGRGLAHNLRGLLFRRQGRLDLAGNHLSLAAALLLVTFDLPSFQGAVFNLGLVRYEEALLDRDPDACAEALKFIELDRELCELGLGRDSAQAEVVAGMICTSLGYTKTARQWLAQGRRIAERIDSDYDRADLFRLEGRLAWLELLRRGKWDQNRLDEVAELYEHAIDYLARTDAVTLDIEAELDSFGARAVPGWLLDSADTAKMSVTGDMEPKRDRRKGASRGSA